MLGLVSLLSYDPLHGVFESESQRELAPDFRDHRASGAAREAPENTLAAFQERATDQGRGLVRSLTCSRRTDGVLCGDARCQPQATTGLDKEFWQVTYDEITKTSTTAAGLIPHSQTSGYARWKRRFALCKRQDQLNIEVTGLSRR